MHELLNKYDVISLNEVKTPLPASLPGFISVKSVCKGTGHRGGTVVLIRHYLAQRIKTIDTAIDDQVWLQFTCLPRVLFGFCYIPPNDSE